MAALNQLIPLDTLTPSEFQRTAMIAAFAMRQVPPSMVPPQAKAVAAARDEVSPSIAKAALVAFFGAQAQHVPSGSVQGQLGTTLAPSVVPNATPLTATSSSATTKARAATKRTTSTCC